MTDERLILAIGRIERALSRLEAARREPPPAPVFDPTLAARHEALRMHAADAIMRIDALLGADGAAEPVATAATASEPA